MKRCLKTFFLGGFILLSFYTNAQVLSKNAQISILTCEVGEEIYALFGHSAMRVKDTSLNIDEVYNYGTFDGYDDNFELKFAKGQLDYSLSKQTIEGFMYEYQYYNRTVYEQVLAIPLEKKREIYSFLLHNNLPENRTYKYDFFYDNCATRIRDLLETTLEEKLKFGQHPWHNKYSFRELIAKDLQKLPLTHFGIDLVLGQRIDVKASSYHLMFHPIYMYEIFDASTYNNHPLVAETKLLYKATKKEAFEKDNTLLYSMWALFILGALFTMFRLDSIAFIFDSIIMYTIGFLGVALLLMWFATDHTATKFNWNIIWANPILLWYPFAVKRKSKAYFSAITFLFFGFFIAWFILPQEYSIYAIPLILYVALRHFYNFRKLR